MKKDETYICKECGKKVRVKSVGEWLHLIWQLCPQCFTMNASEKDRRKEMNTIS